MHLERNRVTKVRGGMYASRKKQSHKIAKKYVCTSRETDRRQSMQRPRTDSEIETERKGLQDLVVREEQKRGSGKGKGSVLKMKE